MHAAAAILAPTRTSFLPFTSKLKVAPVSRKRNICVFDPNKRTHYRSLEGVLKDIVDIHWFDDFSRESLEAGELAEGQEPGELARFKPVMIIVELELLLGSPNWHDGVKLLENFRRSEAFDTGVEVMIISNAHAVLAAHNHGVFERLNVKWTFCWDLLYSPATRHNIQTIVRDLL